MSKEKLHAQRMAGWSGSVLAIGQILLLWWQSSGFQNLLVATWIAVVGCLLLGSVEGILCYWAWKKHYRDRGQW